ncbi:homoserine dehydrogenase [Methanobrevibacter cuticularis]|uniref:Homoserine dehydrogenase n=1 Tax=Methanobrevibacter cuticularis TaxID=47311 RepID=A0A166CYF2_9EURY|nr:homoserine dehydrogenase [Methanobrevibacter cuticularis]KZX14995.1 homoserine dehydrogenase [Methanobrevibacter cuticularis]
MSDNEINIGLIGFGTIGAGVVEIFNKNQDIVNQKCEKQVNLKKVADLDITTDRGVKIDPEILTTDVNDILENDDIDIVIELMGGYEPARTFILKAFDNKKHVISANKALIAKHWEELISTADKNNVKFSFEASVGGGIPVLQTLNENLAANRIEAVYGIMNGTANYILTKMSEDGSQFADVLTEAQEKGYAEADPTFDIEGHDTAQKLIVLTKLGFGEYVEQSKFHVEGISNITPEDIEFAKNELNYAIKLLGIAKQSNGGLEIRVHPTFIPKSHLLASVDDVFNAIYIQGDFVGPVMLYGQGAGRMATASAVVGDCIDLILNKNKKISYGPNISQVEKIKKISEVSSKYYISLKALDRPGVLETITGILNKNGISIESIAQKTNSETQAVPIIIVSHETKEENMQQAIAKINDLTDVKEKIRLIRILEE